jgi:ABC-type glycerol-3-phosphate transport system substrate-binding protein
MHPPQTHMLMGYSKNQKAAKDFLRWASSRKVFERWFMSQKGFSIPAAREWSKHALWNEDPIMAPFRDVILTARAGLAGPVEPQGRRGRVKIRHHRHVRQSGAWHAGRRRHEVGSCRVG